MPHSVAVVFVLVVVRVRYFHSWPRSLGLNPDLSFPISHTDMIDHPATPAEIGKFLEFYVNKAFKSLPLILFFFITRIFLAGVLINQLLLTFLHIIRSKETLSTDLF